MTDRISPGRMNAIDFMLAHPGRFTKSDWRDAAAQLRAEIGLLNEALQRTLPADPTSPDVNQAPATSTTNEGS